MRKFRFHIIGMAHLPCKKKYCACAFTQKIYKMCKMLMSLGHEVILYGLEGSDKSICTEFVEVLPLSEIRRVYGDGDNRFPELGYDYKTEMFRHDINKPLTEATIRFNENCIREINKRKKNNDFLLVMQGIYQRPIADKIGLYLTCEPGIGYRGSYCNFRAFESSYIQNFTYGSQNPFKSVNGRYYDRVIPNYFDPNDFEFRKEKDDYFLYMGRLIIRKGTDTAHKVTREIGAKLKIAGQGMKSWDGKRLVADDFTIEGDDLEYVGFAEGEKKRELLSGAKALFAPTTYLEPFGGVAIEAMMSGTPVITTNFGVFPETILSGIVGYRCDTLDDFVWTAKHIGMIG